MAEIVIEILAVILIFAILYLIFTAGRIYENCVMIREIDEKIDEIMLKGGE